MPECKNDKADQLSKDELDSLRNWLQKYNSVILGKMIRLDFRTILKAAAGEKIQKASVFYLRAKLKERAANVTT